MQFGWALVIGLLAALVGSGVRWLATLLRARVEHHALLFTPVVGLGVALLAISYAASTGHDLSDVLFSGQSALSPLLTGAPGYAVGALLVLLLCKGLAYGLSLSGFRGGPKLPMTSVLLATLLLFSDGLAVMPLVIVAVVVAHVVSARISRMGSAAAPPASAPAAAAMPE